MSDKSDLPSESVLIKVFKAALDVRPFLLFEIGYTRPTDWMVHVWDSANVGIARAECLFTVQSHDRDTAFFEAAQLLRVITTRNDDGAAQ